MKASGTHLQTDKKPKPSSESAKPETHVQSTCVASARKLSPHMVLPSVLPVGELTKYAKHIGAMTISHASGR